MPGIQLPGEVLNIVKDKTQQRFVLFLLKNTKTEFANLKPRVRASRNNITFKDQEEAELSVHVYMAAQNAVFELPIDAAYLDTDTSMSVISNSHEGINEDEVFFVIDSSNPKNNSHFFRMSELTHPDGPKLSDKLKG